MGMDITVFVDRLDQPTGKRVSLWRYVKNDDKYEKCPVYVGRNYALFDLLAGARTPFNISAFYPGYLVTPRGLPQRLTDDEKATWVDDGSYFNATWYDFCELEAYEQTLSQAKRELDKKNKKIEELERRLKAASGRQEDEDDGDMWDDGESTSNVIDALSSFVSDVRAILGAYGVYEPAPGEVRVVMWFDN